MPIPDQVGRAGSSPKMGHRRNVSRGFPRGHIPPTPHKSTPTDFQQDKTHQLRAYGGPAVRHGFSPPADFQ